MIKTKKQKKVLERLLKISKSEFGDHYPFAGKAFMDLGKQWFLCPYYFVGLNEPLTEFENSDDGFPMLNFCKNAYPTSPVTTPDVRLMEKYLRVHAPEDRKGLTFSFGFAHFNFRFLLDLLIVFPDAKLYHSGRWNDPLWFLSKDGYGYLLPKRPLKDGKIPLATVLEV